jgi:hypothetical protein
MATSKIKETMKSNPTWWQTISLTLVCSLITAFFAWGLTRSSNNADNFTKKFDEKADIKFVIDQDNQIKTNLKNHVESDDKRWNIMFDDLKEIKENQRLIYNKLIK